MIKQKLNKLLENIDIEYINDKNVFNGLVVENISTDTRTLKGSALFIALKGENFDGHDFIAEAVKKGAYSVIFDIKKIGLIKNLKLKDILFIGVKDTLSVLAGIAKNYLKNFPKIRRFVLTGSSGKTTTKGLIANVLSKKYRVLSNKKSYNNIIGVSKTILNIENNYDIYVQEIGTNHPGEIEYLAKIVEPDYGLITNIGTAHIGFFGSVKAIAREKKSLLERLPEDGIAFVNGDDEYFHFLINDLNCEVVQFGFNSMKDLVVREISVGNSRFSYKDIDINLGLGGRHNILNASAAIKVGEKFSLSLKEIKDGIESFKPESGRGVIKRINGTTIIDESYNANPESVKASIQYLEDISAGGKRIMVLGDMAELGSWSEFYHRKVAEWFKKSKIDYLMLVGLMTEHTYNEGVNIGARNIKHFNNIDEIEIYLKKLIGNNDIVLVKGSRIMGLEKLIDRLGES